MKTLKEKIEFEFKNQNSNDPIVHPVIENGHGSIEVNFKYGVGNGIDVSAEVNVHPNHNDEFYKLSHSSTCLIDEGEFEANEDVVEIVHAFILKYLKKFQTEKSMMEKFGFQCMGFDWYQYNDLHVIRLIKDSNYAFLIGSKVVNFKDVESDELDDFDAEPNLFEALRIYASKDLNNYLLLPSRLRDSINVAFEKEQ